MDNTVCFSALKYKQLCKLSRKTCQNSVILHYFGYNTMTNLFSTYSGTWLDTMFLPGALVGV